MQYPKNILGPVLDHLKKLEHDLLHRKASLNAEDPYAAKRQSNDHESDDVMAEDQFGHAQSEALSEETSAALKRVQGAVQRIDEGTYGKCTACGAMIDTDRLGVDPTAELCMTCAKQLS